MREARRAVRWAAALALLSAGAGVAAAQPSASPAPDLPAGASDAAAVPGAAAPGDRQASTQRPAPPAPATAFDLSARPGLEGLRGGGEAAPLCRARCAPAFYTCVSAYAGDGGCHLALAVCRRGCEGGEPPPGRLQSPLPAAGLAPAGALRALPGGLQPLQ